MVFEIIFRVYPGNYGIKMNPEFSKAIKKEREEKYLNSLAKLVDEIIDFSYFYSKEKKYEEIFFEGRLENARSINLDKVRKILYLQLYNDEIIGFNPRREIPEVYLERVLFENLNC